MMLKTTHLQIIKNRKEQIVAREWYIVEVTGEGCYALCYDDENGERVVVDWELEIRED